VPADAGYVVVLGGNVVTAKGPDLHTAPSFTNYLEDISRITGKPVHWFAKRSADDYIDSRIDPAKVIHHGLNLFRERPVHHELRFWRSDELEIVKRAMGVIEFFPAMLGAGSASVMLSRCNYLVYFPSSPITNWTYQLSRIGALEAVLKLGVHTTYGMLATIRAGAVLVRDEVQLERLRRIGFRNVVRSRPIISTRHLEPSPRREIADEVRLLFVGHLQRLKGIDVLIRALGELSRTLEGGTRATLTLVGDAPDTHEGWPMPEIRQFAASHGVGDRIEFKGFVSDPDTLGDIYRSADILVHPARMEGFPRVIDEAMLVGLPVVASRIPQIASVLEDGKDALLFDRDDPGELARQLSRIIRDPDLMRRLCDASRARGESLRQQSAAQQHVDLIKELEAAR